MVLRTSAWSSIALDGICTDNCTSSLSMYIASVDSACGADKLYNISGNIQTADSAAKELLWKQKATCLKDPDSGDYCNIVLQEAVNTTDPMCRSCALSYLMTVANAKWGQQIASPDDVASQVSSCSATGYSVTSTPTAMSVSASETSSAALDRCNATGVDTTTDDNDTCVSLSEAFNVSTPALINTNALDTNCASLKANMTLCLPPVCDIHLVSANDTCDSIIGSLARQVSLTTFRSWNPRINSRCSNLQAIGGQYICVSPPGSLTIPAGFPLAPAKTAA